MAKKTKTKANGKTSKKAAGDAKPKTKKSTKGVKTKTKKSSAGRKNSISRDAKITVLAKKNPRRPGTAVHKRFALYKTGMTVGQFIEKGGTMGSVRGDLRRGNIGL